MGFQDSLPQQTLTPTNIKEEEEELEETETLSLCDLPLYSDQSHDWDDQHSSTTTTSSDQDYFEFFSQELVSSAAFLPPQNIIFCGKLIPYKHLPTPNDKNQITLNTTQTGPNKTSRWRWRLSGTTKCTTAAMQRRAYNSGKQVKVKWYFFLFGVSRFSPVVELSDIRSRQSRRRTSPPPPPSSPVMFGFDDGEVMGDRGWGLWGLIRALSCGGGRRPTAVAAVAAS
ncbi:uncharacterized protein LOC125189669 [Salvia hispanica]|uniref:uncharacterized protein LOC125189669 n=1 Tax=Salvia hispanica TaxID=49212 RepID=UPI002009D5B6|nr:uncharacterized protein LOC125189669 [Salvia hispanica]